MVKSFNDILNHSLLVSKQFQKIPERYFKIFVTFCSKYRQDTKLGSWSIFVTNDEHVNLLELTCLMCVEDEINRQLNKDFLIIDCILKTIELFSYKTNSYVFFTDLCIPDFESIPNEIETIFHIKQRIQENTVKFFNIPNNSTEKLKLYNQRTKIATSLTISKRNPELLKNEPNNKRQYILHNQDLILP